MSKNKDEGLNEKRIKEEKQKEIYVKTSNKQISLLDTVDKELSPAI